MANFVSPFEKWGRRRCRFRLSWHYFTTDLTIIDVVWVKSWVVHLGTTVELRMNVVRARLPSKKAVNLMRAANWKQRGMVFCYQNCYDLLTVRKNCSSDWEKLLKFQAEGWEFAKFLRSLEQIIQTVKGQNNFW